MNRKIKSYAVIIPTYNCANFIKETLETVKNQTIPPANIIIVDDHSTDNTVALIKNLSIENMVLLQTQRNTGGPACGRNIGINWLANQQDKPDFISFLDSDDLWSTDFAETMLQSIDNAAAAFCMVKKFSRAAKHLKSRRCPRKIIIPNWVFLLCNPVTSCSANLIRFGAIENVRFKEDPCYIAHEDYYFFEDIINKNGNAIFLCGTYVNYRIREGSLSNRKLRMTEKRIKIHKKNGDSAVNAAFKAAFFIPAKFIWRTWVLINATI